MNAQVEEMRQESERMEKDGGKAFRRKCEEILEDLREEEDASREEEDVGRRNGGGET